MKTGTSAVITVTDESFEREVEQAKGLVVVDFGADWCGPCRMMAPIVERLAEEFEGRAKIGKLDVDANRGTAARFNVRSLPSILLFRDGALVDTVVGAVPAPVLRGRIADHLAS